MPIKAFNDKDEEIEVYSVEEHNTAVATAVTAEAKKVKDAADAEWKPKVTTLETELTGAKKALGDRASEFGKFRELHADVVEKLSVSERALYENQKAMNDEKIKREKEDSERRVASVDASLRETAGTDQKLFDKMKSMWDIIGINAVTAGEIETKKKMILGAISTTEPNLVASVAGFSGGFKPPVSEKKEGESYADTESGKSLAKGIGLDLEPKKK